EVIAHLWLAAVFMYLFVRQITANRAAAIIASFTFTFSGYLTGYPSQQLAVLEADIWLPLILYFLHRASQHLATTDHRPPTTDLEPQTIDHRRQNNNLQPSTFNASRPSAPLPLRSPAPMLLFAGLAWSLTLLAGHPQSAFIVACVSCAYLAFLLFQTGDGRVRSLPAHRGPTALGPETRKILLTTHYVPRLTSYVLPLASYASRFTLYASRLTHYTLHTTHYALRFTLYTLPFLLTGFALAAIQFIPAVEYTLLSVRAKGTYDKMSGGFPIVDAIQFLLPGQISHYSPLYVGIVSLILALWVVFAAPNRHTTFWAIVAFITLLISFGGNTFLYIPLYLTTPGFSIFRGQERWAFAVAFSLSVLAGYGFAAMIGDRRVRSLPVGPETGTAAQPNTQYAIRNMQHAPERSLPLGRTTHYALRLTIYLFLFSLLLTFLFFFGLNQTGWTPDSPFYGLLGVATLLTILLALAWLLWKFAPQTHPTLFTTLTAALICFDLFSVNWQTNLYPQPPEWHTQMPAIVAAIKKDAAGSPDEPYRVYNEFRLYDNYGIPYEIEDLWGASPLRPLRYDQFLAPPMPIERTWELLNVKYVITWRKELYVPSTIIYEEPAEKDTTYVHRLTTVGPRAWLVNQVEVADDATILQKIADPNFDRWHIALMEPDAEPFIEPMTKVNQQTSESANLTPSGTHYALRTSAKPPLGTHYASRFTLHVTSPTPALLILSEIAYPGWQATVGGQPAPTLRAYYTLRAIPVPAGKHTVELSFRPLSFTIGAIISIVSIIVVAAISFLTRRASR
ncbi:MAG: YfhO family protein, partial [Chloroflexi bacterium]|nr:YfhO family protein [Chloroflexota bacterium]